jgi:gluconate kinase
MKGFGLARLHKEGSPMHPDDLIPKMNCKNNLTDEQYKQMLARYNEYWEKEKANDGTGHRN